jgi:hypothetical protein
LAIDIDARLSQVLELLEAAVLSAGFDNSIRGRQVDGYAWDSQPGAWAATLVASGNCPHDCP